MLNIRSNKLALAAAGFAVLSLLSTIPFWTAVFFAWPYLGARDLGDFYATYVAKMTAGVAVSVLAIGLLLVPLLTGYGVRHLQALATLCAICGAALFLLYDTYWFGEVFALSSFPFAGTPLWSTLVAVLGMIANPISVGFAIATAIGAHRLRAEGVPAA